MWQCRNPIGLGVQGQWSFQWCCQSLVTAECALSWACFHHQSFLPPFKLPPTHTTTLTPPKNNNNKKNLFSTWPLIPLGAVAKHKRKCSGIYWGGLSLRGFAAEGQYWWTAEGARVNYSITKWLNMELFKQVMSSRELGLITVCKNLQSWPVIWPSLTASILAILANIHMWEVGGEVCVGGVWSGHQKKKKRIKARQRHKNKERKANSNLADWPHHHLSSYKYIMLDRTKIRISVLDYPPHPY